MNADHYLKKEKKKNENEAGIKRTKVLLCMFSFYHINKQLL